MVVAVVANFFAYLLMGVSSVAYYHLPIGDVMTFVYHVVELGGAAAVTVFALLTFLHQMPRFRKRLERLVAPWAQE